MPKKMSENKILRGNYGKVWVNGERFANVKQFESKVTGTWEDVDIMGIQGKPRRLMGFEGEGTMTLHKIDSSVARLIGDGFKTGDMPEIKIIASLDDPTAYGAERVELIGVTFDELMLMKFENKALVEEEVPFKFYDFNFIDLI